MSCSAAQLPTPAELPAGSDTRRPRRQRASGRGGLIRDNIENALSTPSSQIPVTHINEEQSKRKRQSPSDCASKRRKVLQDTPPLTPQSSTLNITPLHRTLSEKSAYLNRASLSDVNPGRKESPSKISSTLACNGLSQSKRSGCESEDADDEDEPSVLNAVRSTSKTPTPQPPNDVPIVQLPLSYPGFDGNSAASTAKISLATGIPFSSFEDDLFGSDTTLTSPEDDSEDEEQSKTSPTQPCDVTPPSPSSQVPSTQLAAAPVKRRGPGRPRKNPLPDATSSKPCRRRTRKSVSEAKEAPSGALPETLPFAVHTTGSIQLSTTASVVPERPIGGTRVSLMARIIDAKVSQRVLDDDDSELSDDAEVQLGKQTEAPLTASMAAQECQSDFVQANGSAPDSDHSLERTDQTSVVTSTSDHVSAPTSSKLALPSTEAKDHVFAVPTAAARRAVRSSARARSFTDRRYSHRRPVSRQNYTRPILRHMPRPRLHQTCLEIVSRSASAQEQPSIQRIASMLRCRLQKAVQCSRDDAMENTPSTNIMGQEQKSLQMQAWGAVIGNGKGLGNNWTRKQEDQQQRVVERRAIVADAYRALHFPPPPENWDKSSKVIDAGYSLKNEPDTSVASGTISERWTAVRDDALDHLSRRVGCEYCRKTFRNRNGLIAHTGRCTMARLQTSISSDMDESTASETEEQRKARCPKASYGKSSSSQDEYDDEDAVIMCLCGSKEDEGAMIQCDKCKVWLHMECVNLSEEDVPEEYFCPMCLGLPTPSTAGKSFRPTTKANPRRSDLLRHQSRSDDSGSDSDDLDVDVVRHNARRPRSAPNKIVLSYESSGLDDDDTDDEDSILEEVNGGLGSPQVVLNHSLSDIEDGEYLDDDECMAVCGVKLTRALKQRRAPGLMLDGSSSQEVQPEGTFLSGDLGHCDNSLLVFQQLGALELSPMKMDSDSGVDLSFHRSQSMEFLVSAETLFDPEYKSFDGYKSFEEYSSDLLLSESTLESDGLQTPVDLPHSGDLWIAHDLDSFVEETPEGFLKDV